jgi:hypothetical protein
MLGRHLARLSELQPKFCKDVFPILCHDILLQHFSSSGHQVRKVLSNHVNAFFEKHFRLADTVKGQFLRPLIYLNVRAVSQKSIPSKIKVY